MREILSIPAETKKKEKISETLEIQIFKEFEVNRKYVLRELLWSIEDERDIWGSIDEYDKYDGSGLLYYAFKHKITQVIEALQPKKLSLVGMLMKGLDKKISDGCSLLHRACEEGNVTIVEALLEIKVNLNAKAVNGSTPVHYAFCEKTKTR